MFFIILKALATEEPSVRDRGHSGSTGVARLGVDLTKQR